MTNYSGFIGQPVFVGRSGQVVTQSGSFNSGGLMSGDQIQSIGTALNSGGFNVQVGTAYQQGQILSGMIGAGAVSSGNIASGTIPAPFTLGSGTIQSGNLGSQVVQTGNLGIGAVTGTNIASGAVNTANIGNDAIINIHINPGAVLSGNIGSGQIGLFHMASGFAGWSGGAGGGVTLGSGTIQSGNIGSQAVQTGNIVNGAITTSLIANGAVQSGNIGSGQIGANHIASGVLGTPSLTSGIITSGLIGAGAVSAVNLASQLIVPGTYNVSPFNTPLTFEAPFNIVCEEMISGVGATPVSISASGNLRQAMASIPSRMPCVGLVVGLVTSGTAVGFISQGTASFASGTIFSGYLGQPLYVGRSGQVVTASGTFNSGGFSSGDIIQQIGYAVNSGVAYFNVNPMAFAFRS